MSGQPLDKKKKLKSKRRKTSDKYPRLIVLSYEEEEMEVECKLELGVNNSITFKFAVENDEPEEIADNLVSEGPIKPSAWQSCIILCFMTFPFVGFFFHLFLIH
jgi:hypothetical protein